jgi:hypothetical protein
MKMVARRLDVGCCGTSPHGEERSEANEMVVQSPLDVITHEQPGPYTPSHDSSRTRSSREDNQGKTGTRKKWKIFVFRRNRPSGETGRTVV